MPLSIKFLCFNLFLWTMVPSTLAQEAVSGEVLLLKGQSMVATSPDDSYKIFVAVLHTAKKEKDNSLYSRAVNQLAKLSFGNSKQYDSVRFWTTEALTLLKNGPYDTTYAEVCYNYAEFYNRNNEQVELPIQYFKKAMQIWMVTKGAESAEVAKCYHGLGDIYKYHQFDYQEAEVSYEAALRIREKIHLRDTIVLYRNYYSLAATNRSQKDFEKALSYGTVAMELSKRLDLVRQEITSRMVANIYRDMRNADMAKKYYLEGLKLNAKTKNPGNLAWHYESLGELMNNARQYEQAISYFSKAESIYESMVDKNETLYTNMLLYMAEAYSHTGDVPNFRRSIRKIFSLLSPAKRKISSEASQAFLTVADHHDRNGHLDSALLYCQRALKAAVPGFLSTEINDNPTPEQIGVHYHAWVILARKAALLDELYKTNGKREVIVEKIECLKLAEPLLSQERNTLENEEDKYSFLDTNYDLYEGIISSLYEAREVLDNDSLKLGAYHFFERSKARSLADALSQAEQTRRIGNQDSLLRIHSTLKMNVFRTESKISELMKTNRDSKELNALREQIFSLDRKIQECKSAIEIKYPGYFTARYAYQTPKLAAIQSIARERSQVILEYFWGSDYVYGLCINGSSVLFKRLAKPDSIGKQVDILVAHVNGEHSSSALDAFRLFTSSAKRLYDLLVDPFSSMIDSSSKIQVIPDGAISQIPFEILVREESNGERVDYRSLSYMVKQHSIGYAYSSSMLAGKDDRVIRSPKLLAVGFTGGQRLRSETQHIEALEEIEGAEKEMEGLEKRFKDGKFLVAREATESNFKKFSPDFDIIHLAIHGKGDVKTSFSASLYFRSKYDSVDDGEFHSYELYGLRLKALMAVLSSCESGLGKGYKGEGMLSMASAFTSAGCENTLMSLWKVNDQASTALMDNFYANLQEGEPIDDALRNAKLSYLNASDELTADPKTWAPLLAYGSLQQVFEKDRSNYYVIVSVLALLVLTVVIYKLLRPRRSAYQAGGF